MNWDRFSLSGEVFAGCLLGFVVFITFNHLIIPVAQGLIDRLDLF